MRETRQSAFLSLLAFVAIGSSILTLYGSERSTAAFNACGNNTDCGCSAENASCNKLPESGFCNASSAACVCNAGFSEFFCCPNGCSGNGICTFGGNCSCAPGFEGENCSQQSPGAGACCRGTDCSVTLEMICVLGQGTYRGDGTNCSTNPCPTDCGSALGPECNGECPPSFNCSETSQAPGGGECGCLAGACCFVSSGGPDLDGPGGGFGCTQFLNESSCEDQGGIYQGDGTNCSACETLCAFSDTPACGGQCPPGSTCGFHEANGLPARCECEPNRGACCQPSTGNCFELDEATCEAKGNKYQGDFTNCSSVQCPRDCEFAFGPACNGDCPRGRTCSSLFAASAGPAQGGGAGGPECQCFIPPGGGCVEEPNLCLPGFSCDPASGVCCNRPCDGEGESCDDTGICRVVAPAPAASQTGIVVFLALLIAAGALGLLRLRSRQS